MVSKCDDRSLLDGNADREQSSIFRRKERMRIRHSLLRRIIRL